LKPAVFEAMTEAGINQASSMVGNAYLPFLQHSSRYEYAAQTPTLDELWKEHTDILDLDTVPHIEDS
jgi:hypothetical protein